MSRALHSVPPTMTPNVGSNMVSKGSCTIISASPACGSSPTTDPFGGCATTSATCSGKGRSARCAGAWTGQEFPSTQPATTVSPPPFNLKPGIRICGRRKTERTSDDDHPYTRPHSFPATPDEDSLRHPGSRHPGERASDPSRRGQNPNPSPDHRLRGLQLRGLPRGVPGRADPKFFAKARLETAPLHPRLAIWNENLI